jgi:Site-specific recombinase XerC
MNTWPDPDGAALRHYVKQLRLRSRSSANTYRSFLGQFQRFVVQHAPNEPGSWQPVAGWLRDCVSVRPLHMVIRRACVVNRFLDWLVIEGLIPSNPFAALRQCYGQRSTTPIVRAMLKADPEAALEALRPLPRFASFLGPPMQDWVALMQTRGYRYEHRAATFLRFDHFLQNHPELTDQPLDVLVRKWTESGRQPSTPGSA